MNSIDISANQHLHQQGEQLRPGLGPVPVGDGWHGICNTGADFADRLSQTAGQQPSNGGFSLDGDTRVWQHSAQKLLWGQIEREKSKTDVSKVRTCLPDL